MKKLLILITFGLVFFLASCNSAKKKTFLLSLKEEDLISENIEYYGRHEYKDKQVYFYNTATGFKVLFHGNKIDIKINISNNKQPIYFSVFKNGLEEELSISASKIVSFNYENSLSNTFEIIKRSEPSDGLTSLESVTVNNKFLKVGNSSEDHFLLIGASGISGNGSLGNVNEGRTTKNSSSLHSFGYLTAKHFNASFEFVSASGFGLKTGFNDLSGLINIQSAYNKAGLNYDNSLINTNNIITKQATNIIVNIGGNDYSSYINKLSPSKQVEAIKEFKDNVATFIAVLRKDHPNANIYWTMTTNSKNGLAAKEVIDNLSITDSKYVSMVTIKQVGENNTSIGGNNHASYETHMLSSKVLVDAINKKMNNN